MEVNFFHFGLMGALIFVWTGEIFCAGILVVFDGLFSCSLFLWLLGTLLFSIFFVFRCCILVLGFDLGIAFMAFIVFPYFTRICGTGDIEYSFCF